MRRAGMIGLVLSGVSFAACGTSTSLENRTGLAVYDSTPTATDEGDLEAAGATDVTPVPVLSALAFRTGGLVESFASVPRVVGVYDLGTGTDPQVGLFIVLHSDATAGDLTYLRGLGATTDGPVPAQPNVVPARCPLERLNDLDAWPRVESIELAGVGVPG